MKRGILIYNSSDYQKNLWFANSLVTEAQNIGINLTIVISEELQLAIYEDGMKIIVQDKIIGTLDFAINRCRNEAISFHLEKMGVRVFNNWLTTLICNDKFKTHQFVSDLGLKFVDTYLINPNNIGYYKTLNYPMILKSLQGHGGSEVYKVYSYEEVLEIVNSDCQWLIQDVSTNEGVDIRVFVMGQVIIGAVRRFSKVSFKANVSLGGNSEKYFLSDIEIVAINKIIRKGNFDFVGIDFILDKDNNLLFNEIEDAVGTRTLYSNFSVNVAKMYMDYIKNAIKSIT